MKDQTVKPQHQKAKRASHVTDASASAVPASGFMHDVRACNPASGLEVLEHISLSWSAGRIDYFGPCADMPSSHRTRPEVLAAGALVLPALIDCHTHVVFGGQRADEFAARLAGASYAEIAAGGGGIARTVRLTQSATLEQLIQAALPRVLAMARDGVATIEVKSGYGLSLEAERTMLRAATELGTRTGLQIRRTFLALHALPEAAKASAHARAAWIAEVVEHWLPTLVHEGLVDAVDAFCEGIAFSPNEVAALFDAARALGVDVKLHADQLSDQGGGALAARFNALSADHVEYLSSAGVAAMRSAGTVAVLLPTAFYCLKESMLPPIAALRAQGVRMAIASDCNPGTSPSTSLRLAMHQACTLFGLTIEEALRGVTVHAAKALGATDRGQLCRGMRADFALYQVTQPAEIVYWLGSVPVKLWVGGCERT
jgi:imidazolonepropionase